MSALTPERLAEVRLIIEREILGRNAIAGARYATQELDAAGLLATPEHDAAIYVRELRADADAAEAVGVKIIPISWLRERADRIEREGGAS